ncbi:MAG: putative zinc-binding metallopeptidase [Pseudomonadota bacterium]
MPGRTPITSRKRERQSLPWTRYSDDELLQLRFSDLKLKLSGSPLERRLQRIHGELQKRGITFRPHMWLAEEWFSPDGVPGIAVPFYLAHPRLLRLERRMMKQVEGGNDNWMMRILRHEAGHAVDTAFRLRRRADWREAFGRASLPYPDIYQARPGSRRYVQHLGDWYAQSHPTEDFAETFAVWLKPKSNWRRDYESWPARNKLTLVDDLMRGVASGVPLVRSRRHVEPLHSNRRTLAEHYVEKLRRLEAWRNQDSDGLMLRVFSPPTATHSAPRASTFLRAHRRELVESVARSSGTDRYTIYQVQRIAMHRCDELDLRLRRSERTTLPHVRWLLGGMVRTLDRGARPRLHL